MSRESRTRVPEFKVLVAMEAWRCVERVNDLARDYEIHPARATSIKVTVHHLSTLIDTDKTN